MHIAVLDDYQSAASDFADWGSLKADVKSFTEPFVNEADIVSNLRNFDVLIAMRERTKLPAGVLRQLGQLQLIVTTGWGNAVIDVAAAKELGIVVCGTDYPRLGATPELTWALILAAMRNVPAEARHMAEGGWQTSIGADLEGKTLGLLGLGTIGSRVARVAQAFDMETIAWSQNLTSEKAAEHGVKAVSKRELFTESDVLSIHVRLSDRTRGMVGAEELSLMKSSSLLVNTSRGPIVDEDAMVAALQKGVIGGAALDVFDVEPLPSGHALRALNNVVLTPHIGYVTSGNYEVFYEQAVEDIAAFAAGVPIRMIE